MHTHTHTHTQSVPATDHHCLTGGGLPGHDWLSRHHGNPVRPPARVGGSQRRRRHGAHRAEGGAGKAGGEGEPVDPCQVGAHLIARRSRGGSETLVL